MMVFYGSLWDRKSLQVSRPLLSIMADLNDIVALMFRTFPFISKSSSPFANTLRIISSARITIGFTVTFMFLRYFLVLKQIQCIFHCFRFLLMLPCGLQGRQSTLFGWLSFFFFLLNITKADNLALIR